MKRIVSTLAIILVCVVALSGCSWFSTPVTLADDYDLTEKSTVKSEIFSEIDKLEKTKMDVRKFSHTEDDFMPWAWLLIGIVLSELLLRYTLFRRLP